MKIPALKRVCVLQNSFLMTKVTPTKEIGEEGRHQALDIVRRHDLGQHWNISILDIGIVMVETVMPHCLNNLKKPFGICKSENWRRKISRKWWSNFGGGCGFRVKEMGEKKRHPREALKCGLKQLFMRRVNSTREIDTKLIPFLNPI